MKRFLLLFVFLISNSALATKPRACMSYLLFTQNENSAKEISFIDRLEFVLEVKQVWFQRNTVEDICIDLQLTKEKLEIYEKYANDPEWLNKNGFQIR